MQLFLKESWYIIIVKRFTCRKDIKMNKTEIKFTKLDKRATAPVYGTPFAAGADLRALLDENIKIAPGETVLIHPGIAAQIPDGLVGLVYARSGLAAKRGLAPANCVGVIDSDYRGEIMVALRNYSNDVQEIEHQERIAQLVIAPYISADFIEAETLEETDRGQGGFGSTGRK